MNGNLRLCLDSKEVLSVVDLLAEKTPGSVSWRVTATVGQYTSSAPWPPQVSSLRRAGFAASVSQHTPTMRRPCLLFSSNL